MPNFVWKGKTRTGQAQEGQLLAENRNQDPSRQPSDCERHDQRDDDGGDDRD